MELGGGEAGSIRAMKKAMRMEMKAYVSRLDSEYCIQADRAIFREVTSLREYEEADAIFCFVGTEHEIDTAPVINHALEHGKGVAVPRCTGKGIMEACLIRSLEDLKTGFYGLSEPDEGADRLRPEEIGFAVVPCLTCSSSGKRLGYGGGYYDRYLPHIRGVKALLCRGRVMREAIPVEDHDQTVDLVISENGVLRLDG